MRLRVVAAVAILIAALPAVSNATPIRIDFSFTSVESPLTNTFHFPIGISGSLYFTFDDSLLPDAATTWHDTTTGFAPIDASLSWFGSTFDESSIRIWKLVTDATGALKEWGIGTYGGCGNTQSSGGLSCISSPNAYDDFYATGSLVPTYMQARVILGQANKSGFADGRGPNSLTVLAVPEPSTLGLMALGVLGLLMVRRRRIRASM